MGAACGRVSFGYFYIVAINPNIYIGMSMIEFHPQNISLSSTNVSNELFEVESPFNIQNISDFFIVPFISSWELGCNQYWRTNLGINYHNQINSTAIRIRANKFPQLGIRVYFFRCIIIWVNTAAIYKNNVPYYLSSFQLSHNNNFYNLPSMFGIPTFYYPNNYPI